MDASELAKEFRDAAKVHRGLDSIWIFEYEERRPTDDTLPCAIAEQAERWGFRFAGDSPIADAERQVLKLDVTSTRDEDGLSVCRDYYVCLTSVPARPVGAAVTDRQVNGWLKDVWRPWTDFVRTAQDALITYSMARFLIGDSSEGWIDALAEYVWSDPVEQIMAPDPTCLPRIGVIPDPFTWSARLVESRRLENWPGVTGLTPIDDEDRFYWVPAADRPGKPLTADDLQRLAACHNSRVEQQRLCVQEVRDIAARYGIDPTGLPNEWPAICAMVGSADGFDAFLKAEGFFARLALDRSTAPASPTGLTADRPGIDGGSAADGPVKDGDLSGKRPAWGRDHWFRRQEREGFRPAAIRDKWNKLTDEDRKKICPDAWVRIKGTPDSTRDVVKKALDKANREEREV